MADRKLSQTQILNELHIPTTTLELNEIRGNGKLQQSINQQATLHGLPAPFDPSTGSAIVQDLLPLAALAAVAGGGAAAGAAGAGGAAAALDGAEEAGDGASSAAGTAAKDAEKEAENGSKSLPGGSGSLGDLLKLAEAGGIAALLTDPKFLLRMVEIIGGAALIILGLRQLANAAGAGIPGPSAVAKAAVA